MALHAAAFQDGCDDVCIDQRPSKRLLMFCLGRADVLPVGDYDLGAPGGLAVTVLPADAVYLMPLNGRLRYELTHLAVLRSGRKGRVCNLAL